MRSLQTITRRRYLATSGAATLAAAFGLPGRAAAQGAPVRQGYQTNMWGMPTYYLLRSGALEKRGLRFEEFAVPSGNLTMQQMVARQVDLGTFAGPSFVLGHDKGGIVGIAVIEQVGRTVRIMARKELNLTRVEQLRGLKIANQTGSSIGNIFVDQVGPAAGLRRGDYQEVRMDVNNMVAAMAAKTVDAMINVEPYNSIAEAEGIAGTIMDYWNIDRMPVFMAATPELVANRPERRRRLPQGLARRGARLQGAPRRGGRRHLRLLCLQGLFHVAGDVPQGAGDRGREPRLPVGPQTLHAGPRRGAPQGEEDSRHPGLEQSPAPRVHGARAHGDVG